MIRTSTACVTIASLLLVSISPGCSFLFVKGPPADHARMTYVACTDSNTWPVLDAIWAGLNGLGAATAASDEDNPDRGQIIGVGVAWLALSGAAAIYGFSQVSACNSARQQLNERLLGAPPAAPPGTWPVGAPPPVPPPAGPGTWPVGAPPPAGPGSWPAGPPGAEPTAPPPAAPPPAAPPPVAPGPVTPAPSPASAPGPAATPGAESLGAAQPAGAPGALAMRPAAR